MSDKIVEEALSINEKWNPDFIRDLTSWVGVFTDPQAIRKLYEMLAKHGFVKDPGKLDEDSANAIIDAHPEKFREPMKRVNAQIQYWVAIRKQMKRVNSTKYNSILPIHMTSTPAMIFRPGVKDGTFNVTQGANTYSEVIPPIAVCPKCNLATPMKLEDFEVPDHCDEKMVLL